MDKDFSPQPIRILPILAMAGIGLAVISAAYFLGRKFLRDRESAMNFEPRVVRQIQRQVGPQTTTRTYTAQELEEARKKGKLPTGMNQAYTPPNASGDAAVQRSLKTLDEINRINEMNRRLTEQQQRNQPK